ncbi:hypothetical protein GCM10010277_65300 [Streptomyces longisporoflavus]|uniref:abscisic acid-deficient protein Aba4 family protein n=1 Tax=Streptomyces longisporoflavus TaxID=28044 RepID=UPI00167D3718|nr:abscisic acid-deficient protein Aba4 family protein [Streptomyces longisporoflavus]GGV60871.1 hypothetical protein GCM10010277_65300 [Streptomyces longisporoflavus]
MAARARDRSAAARFDSWVRHPRRAISSSTAALAAILAVYTAMALPVLPELWAAVSSPDIDGFRELLVLANGAGAIWAQVIAWDLLIGQWMYREARRIGLHPLVTGPVLVLTILLSPFGLLLFLLLRAVRGGRPNRTQPRSPADSGSMPF